MENEKKAEGVLEAFSELTDPRCRACEYPLEELLLVAICAITSGAKEWVEVVWWENEKLDWLRRYLLFANGIGSHDTFTRVFSLLNATCFEACFIRWMRFLCPTLAGKVIPIDGKSLRRSHHGKKKMVHLVSAWHTMVGVILVQVKTADKSNEITAIPELLDALQIDGAIITIDAMGLPARDY
ncbi:MAG: ISAs1 family transposase [Solimicrobium sp.]|jgi:predicted transposase YbfD/YdcC|nr:ISAs1 family transposase [Solimicrobium sp.]